MTQAAVQGTTWILLSTQAKAPALSGSMLGAVLNSIFAAESNSVSGSGSIASQTTTHAVSLAALLPGLQALFGLAERCLLQEWLNRLIQPL